MTTTSANDWRQVHREGIEITLPSGNVARIRPLELDFFVKTGKFPDFLANAVYDMMSKGRTDLSLPVEKMDNMKEFITFLDTLTCYAFIAPVVKEAGSAVQENEISVEDVEFFDKRFLWHLFTASSNRLLRFRQEQSGDVAAVAIAGNNGRPSKPTAEGQLVDQS